MNPDGQDTVLTTSEATSYLRICKPTFLKYIRSGRIRGVKAGKGWRVFQSELNRFLSQGNPSNLKRGQKVQASLQP